jgi:hypothetical protein
MNKQKITTTLLSLFIVFTILGQSFKMAVDLDGIDDHAVVPHNDILNPANGSWSVAFWIKAADRDQVSPVVMKRLPEDPYTQYSYGFGKDDPHNPEPGKRLRVNHIEIPGVSERSGYTTHEYIDGEWHHIVFVANKNEDGIQIYFDGEMVDFYPMYSYGSWPDVSTDNDLIIASGSSGTTIEGPLDELSIWNKALTQSQVQTIINDTMPPLYYNSSDSGLVAYYRFDKFEDLGVNGGGADDFRDLSIWGNHADTEGNPVLIPSISTTSIVEQKTELEFDVYPNPCSGKIQITNYKIQTNSKLQNSKTKIEIIDLFGKVAYEEEIVSRGEAEISVDVGHLPAGLYLVKLQTEEAVGVRKIIIK